MVGLSTRLVIAERLLVARPAYLGCGRRDLAHPGNPAADSLRSHRRGCLLVAALAADPAYRPSPPSLPDRGIHQIERRYGMTPPIIVSPPTLDLWRRRA